MEGHYATDSCAQYLTKFYILPHTYRQSIIVRFFLAPFLIVDLTVLLTSILLPYHISHKLTAGVYFALMVIAGASFFLLSATWRKTVITRHSIDITLTLSKTLIPASNIVGYALDSVRQSRGPDGWVLSIVHNEPGKPQTKTRFACSPDDLNDPKLQGLFMSMSNYGDVPLGTFLDDVGSGKYPRLEKIALVVLIMVTVPILRFCLPVIWHALK
ncbi:MAG TPA: hypothetical protein VL997_08215 [Dyella sp.]|nr:hypothetical protein [Dyella sp.]